MRKANSAGQVCRMANSRIPKHFLWWIIHHGRRKFGGQPKRYKYPLNVYLKDFNINTTTWENAASDRWTWRSLIHKGTTHHAEAIHAANEKHGTRKVWAFKCCRYAPHPLVSNLWEGLSRPNWPYKRTHITPLSKPSHYYHGHIRSWMMNNNSSRHIFLKIWSLEIGQ